MMSKKKIFYTHTLMRFLQRYLVSYPIRTILMNYYSKWAGSAKHIQLFVGYNYKHELRLSVAIVTKEDMISCPVMHGKIQAYLGRYYEHIKV